MTFSWLVLSLYFTFGYIPEGQIVMYSPPSRVVDSGMFYQQFDVEANLFKWINVGGTIKVEDWILRDEFSFLPQSLLSAVYVEVEKGPITLGFKHTCIHPVIPYQPIFGLDSLMDAFRQEIYLRVGGKL
jgi:hypothetical protein